MRKICSVLFFNLTANSKAISVEDPDEKTKINQSNLLRLHTA